MLVLAEAEASAHNSQSCQTTTSHSPTIGNNMKNLLLILISLLTLCSCAQEKNCLDFKTGEFVYVDKNQPEIIIRTDSLQIETNPKTGVVIHSSIKWTSNCNYIMTYEKILNYPDNINYMIGQKIYVEILETNGNRIKVRAKSKRIDNEIEFVKTD